MEPLLAEATERTRHALGVARKAPDLDRLARDVARRAGVTEAELRSGRRRRAVSHARKRCCQMAMAEAGVPGAAVARFLGVTTSAVNRSVVGAVGQA
ncbi:MAG TPA: hypothetical protein VLT62_30340 [Candidatus Methylomirabilis sp.]|nr:hypothetical protein [Candidatus Methylomirabilis sp.]